MKALHRVGVLLSLAVAAAAGTDSLAAGHVGAGGYLVEDGMSSRSPIVAGASSLLFPGLGQVYAGKYLKAGTFVAFEGVAASMAYYWHVESTFRGDLARQYSDSADLIRHRIQGSEPASMTDSVGFDSKWLGVASYSLLAELTDYRKREARCRSTNALTWAATGHFFNILDAVGAARGPGDAGVRSPATAGWLAAVPALGLGQLYNGAISKAGMAFMTQVSLGMIALNYHLLMVDAEEQYKRLNDPGDFRYLVRNDYSDDWAAKRRNAFKVRNTYLWYSIFTYFYWMFDAVVDANLHDYPERMKIRPDLEPRGDGVSAGLTVKF